MNVDIALIKYALAGKCARCRKGNIYRSRLSVSLRDTCTVCDLNLSANDSADGPAVFLIFILGTLLVPLALMVEYIFYPALWLHAILWGTLALIITIGALRPVKSYVIALEYKHRPGDWQ